MTISRLQYENGAAKFIIPGSTQKQGGLAKATGAVLQVENAGVITRGTPEVRARDIGRQLNDELPSTDGRGRRSREEWRDGGEVQSLQRWRQFRRFELQRKMYFNGRD